MRYANSKEIHSADTIPDRSCTRRETDRLLAKLTSVERNWIGNGSSLLAARAKSLLALYISIKDDPALQGELCGVIEQIIKTKAAYGFNLFRPAQRDLNSRQLGDVLQNHICWIECEISKAHGECDWGRYELLKSVYDHLRKDVLERP